MVRPSAVSCLEHVLLLFVGCSWELLITFLDLVVITVQVANLVGFVIGPSGINWLISRFFSKEGIPRSDATSFCIRYCNGLRESS